MSYTLKPLHENIVVIPLKTKEVQEYTGKFLTEPDSGKLDVLSYGRVVRASTSIDFPVDTIILYQKLAAHKTNFGDPRQVLVSVNEVEGILEQADD